MNIKIHSNELNRALKILVQCIETKVASDRANICFRHEDNKLTMWAEKFNLSGTMSVPVMGGDGEEFAVDGAMLAKVCALCKGEIGITTDGKVCTIKGVGRTRLPIVDAKAKELKKIKGKSVKIDGGKLARAFDHVRYAVSTDEIGRPILTGALVETDGSVLRMVGLDGFQMSLEETDCDGADVKAVVPGAFMGLVAGAVVDGETVELVFTENAVQVRTEDMMLQGVLLSGEFPDYRRIIPASFKTRCRVRVEDLRDTLKAGKVINSKQNLVKLNVGAESITVSNNAEAADFEAEVACETQGDPLLIAFNERYLSNTIGAVDTEDAEMSFNGGTGPVVVKSVDDPGVRLVLPVRVMG